MDNAGNVLLVDDQPSLLKFASRLLQTAGFAVEEASDGVAALDILNSHPIDIIVADIVMPRMNGYQLYQRVMQNPAWVSIPFIMLSSRDLDTDIRYGKEMGVDDYLTKPFKPDDLVASVRGKIERSRRVAEATVHPRHSSPGEVCQMGDLHVDLGRHSVHVAGKPIPLSATEFRLLAHLAQRPDVAVSLEELVKETHDLVTDAGEAGSLLRPIIRNLRRKLGFPAGTMGCIESIRGFGYRLIALEAE